MLRGKRLRKVKTISEKLKALQTFYKTKRHKGDWTNETKEAKFWSFLTKDFSQKAWKYCLWLLLRKLMLAAAMGLTISAINAGCVVLLQADDVSGEVKTAFIIARKEIM